MKTAVVYSNELNRLIEATKGFLAPKNAPAALVCYYIKLEFHADRKEVIAVALDGYRLSVEYGKAEGIGEDFEIYLVPNTKFPVKKYLQITVSELDSGTVASIYCDNVKFEYVQPNMKPFDWKAAIPTSEVKYRIGFNAEFLIFGTVRCQSISGKYVISTATCSVGISRR